MLPGKGQALRAIGCLMHGESLALKIETQKFTNIGFVFNYQYLLAHMFHLYDANRVQRLCAPN